jgi:dienelactone hydrolase
MDIIEEAASQGVVERRFDLKAEDEVVPGIHWLPEGATEPHATVCIGHGGFQHKRADNVLALARQLVRHLGVGVIALDAPEHGDRMSDPEAMERARRTMVEQSSTGDAGRAAIDRQRSPGMIERTAKHVAEWRTLLDDLAENPSWAGGPFGWWGVSMGTTHGLPLVAEEPRITAAVLGLNALRPGDDAQAQVAARVTVPVLFLLQSEDELMTRDAGLALWDALGSKEKTLHLNPGGHLDMPRFERVAAEDFFRRHLVEQS